MKFKKVHKVLAAVLSVLTMMPNCYQLVPEEVKKSTTQKAGGDVGFLSKNTTMTVGERIVKDIVLVLGTLGVGGVIASKCSGTKSPVDKATVTQTEYGYNIENSIARIVIFSAKKRDGRPSLWMMYELKNPYIFSSLPVNFYESFLEGSLKLHCICRTGLKGVSFNERDKKLIGDILSIAGTPSEALYVICKFIEMDDSIPAFNSIPVGIKYDTYDSDICSDLYAAIIFGFGKSNAESLKYSQQVLDSLRAKAPKYTCELLDTGVENKLMVLPMCEINNNLTNFDLSKRSIYNTFNRETVFSPAYYCEFYKKLNKLKSFNYILQDAERCEKVLEVLKKRLNPEDSVLYSDEFTTTECNFNEDVSCGCSQESNQEGNSSDLDKVTTTAHHSDATVLYEYLIGIKGYWQLIEEKKAQLTASVRSICKQIIEDGSSVYNHQQDVSGLNENLSDIESAAFNMAVALDSASSSSYNYFDDCSRIVEGMISDSTLFKVDTLKKALNNEYIDLIGNTVALKYSIEEVVKEIKKINKDVSAISAEDEDLNDILEDLKTEIDAAIECADSILSDIAKRGDDAEFNDIRSRFSDLKTNEHIIKIYSLKEEIDKRIANGAKLIYSTGDNMETEYNGLVDSFRKEFGKTDSESGSESDEDEEEEEEDEKDEKDN